MTVFEGATGHCGDRDSAMWCMRETELECECSDSERLFLLVALADRTWFLLIVVYNCLALSTWSYFSVEVQTSFTRHIK